MRNAQLQVSGTRVQTDDFGDTPDRRWREVKVLLVDNDIEELDITAFVLRRDGFAVVEASDQDEALMRFRRHQPDVVVVSLELLPSGGLDVLRHIRSEGHTPVLVTIERSDRLDTFRRYVELGADDFITKPCVPRELALRINAMLARADGPDRQDLVTPLAFDDLRLEPETNEVTRGSSQFHLTPTEFRIFWALVKNANHVVPAHRLLAYLRVSYGAPANSLRSHICHLRKKLALDGGDRGSISSVPAVGYVFRAPAARGVAALSDIGVAEVRVGA